MLSAYGFNLVLIIPYTDSLKTPIPLGLSSILSVYAFISVYYYYLFLFFFLLFPSGLWHTSFSHFPSHLLYLIPSPLLIIFPCFLSTHLLLTLSCLSGSLPLLFFWFSSLLLPFLLTLSSLLDIVPVSLFSFFFYSLILFSFLAFCTPHKGFTISSHPFHRHILTQRQGQGHDYVSHIKCNIYGRLLVCHCIPRDLVSNCLVLSSPSTSSATEPLTTDC